MGEWEALPPSAVLAAASNDRKGGSKPAGASTLAQTNEEAMSEGAERTIGLALDEEQPDPVHAWPQDARERGDFYHRPRVFPDGVRQWRDALVGKIAENPARFPAIPRNSSSDEKRTLIDDGLARLREITRIVELLYGTPGVGTAPDKLAKPALPVGGHAGRVLVRLGVFSELGVDLERLDRKQLQALLPNLVPPPLQRSLHANLDVHGRNVCKTIAPDCPSCDLRNFCRTYRRAQVAAARSSKAPRIIDLFCGAGGLSEGFSRAGFQVVAAADLDPTALRTLALNHPSVPPEGLLGGDIRELDRRLFGKLVGRRRLDVLAGAPPCQGFSSAGFRSKSTRNGYRAIGDERNYLFEWLVGSALELQPRLFLMENVPGMKSARQQDVSFLDAAARRLQAGGYVTTLWQLNSAAFGVPQERTRCFLVAAAPDVELPAQPPEEYQNTRTAFDVDALPPVNLTEAIFDLPPLEAGRGTAVARRQSAVTDGDVRLRRYLSKFHLRERSKLIYNHYARYQNEQDLELYALLQPGEDSVHAIERYGRADLMRYRRDVFDDKYFRLRGDRPSKTIVSHLAKDGNGYIHPTQTRGITPREAARLQSFRDRYAFCGSPTDQWSQIGNAVPPVMAEKIARSFLVALRRG